jgi:hypothetical protein
MKLPALATRVIASITPGGTNELPGKRAPALAPAKIPKSQSVKAMTAMDGFWLVISCSQAAEFGRWEIRCLGRIISGVVARSTANLEDSVMT